ncbi:hypothetical protein [Polaribacter tangerinus]|uniref:hypothetical protein n=1 Tax=Polaribacter tangerinus TaxID=1920034 RepID=UPI000B4A9412|nr:hypothetical protein [Polaribacter tangerinus]
MASLFSNYSKEALQKKLKSQKKMFYLKVIIVILMIAFSIFYTLENNISFYTFLPLFFIPMTIYMYLEMKKIAKELKSRK